jgi:hypothetical protein
MKSRLPLLVLAALLASCGGDTDDPPPPAGPPAPENLVALAEDRSVRLRWDDVAGASSYNLYWTNDGSTPTRENGDRITGPESPFLHVGLTNNTEYRYVVTSRDSQGEGVESEVVSATPGVGPLPAPEELHAGVDDGQINLTWDAVPFASSYNLYWTDDGSTPTTASNALSGVTSPYTHTGLTNGTAYAYIVATASPAGEGPPSNVASAAPTPGPFIGTVGLNLQVCNVSSAGVLPADDSAGLAWWIEDASGNYLDTVVYYPLHPLAPGGYANANMPAWQAAAESLVDGITEASLYNDDIRNYLWDGRDRHGSRLPYGTYTMRFEIGDWDPATHVTDTDMTLGASADTATDTNAMTCAGLTYTYTP